VVAKVPESQVILQQMEQVRRDLDQDLEEIVEGARGMGDWHAYVRAYPWVFVGSAVALGYLVVPRRQVSKPPDVELLAELAEQSRLAASEGAPAKHNTRGILLAFAGNLAMRGIASYAGQLVGNILAAHPASSSSEGNKS